MKSTSKIYRPRQTQNTPRNRRRLILRKVTRRYLRPTKPKNRDQEFYVFDTETGKIDKHGNIEYCFSARPEHLIFGVVYGYDFIKVLHSPEEFRKEFLKARYKNKMVYAHNAEYDLSAVYGNIYEMDKSAIFNGKFISATNGNCKFADSYNILPTKAEKLGLLLGIPKGKLGNNLVSHVNNLEEDIEYCTRDCEIVYESLLKVFTEVGPVYTIGSLSLKTFRCNFLERTIKINEYSDKFFDALHGGRTEAFKIGDCHGYVYDINSAYPWAMANIDLPDPSKLRKGKPKDIDDERLGGMITATIQVDVTTELPVLPIKLDGKLIFPAGRFTGSWCLNEFRFALKHNTIHIEKIHELIVAPLIKSPFRKFILYYYNKRNETNDEFLRYYYKLLMNNLYGKLVQRARDDFRFEKDVKSAVKYMRENNLKRCELIQVIGGVFIKYDAQRVFQHTIACWGAYITAQVRTKLYEMLGAHYVNLLYCDTDSVVLSKELSLNNSDLGGWKKEKKVITNIRSLKDYISLEEDETGKLTHKLNLKGVKKGAQQLDKYGSVFKQKRMIRTRESLRRVDNLPPGTFIDQIKFVTGDYKKRTVLKDGSTKPFIL